jgi:GNAT superfamily N-acetyltransferase
MLDLIQAEDSHQTTVHDLFYEYLAWVFPVLYREYGVEFDLKTFLEHDMSNLQIFMPPAGRLLLAYNDGVLAGCACVRTIGAHIAELKRMYVRPAYRRKGIGRALVEASIHDMRSAGYAWMRLDSARFMTDAHSLYRSTGFHEIAPYAESEIPEAYRIHRLFMEQALR